MHKHVLSAVALVVLALACAGEAGAAVQRTFVSGLGNDANPCSRTEPCRTFAAAIAQTLAGGEVLALDTAGYGPVAIEQAVSLISPPGVYAGITTTSPGTDAISVNAGPLDVVVLKGLSLSGLGLGADGVRFTSGRTLRVEGVTISGFASAGIEFDAAEPPLAGAAPSRLTVTDSLIRDNGSVGIDAEATEGQLARVAVDGTRLLGNLYGVYAGAGSRVNVRDSGAVANLSVGFYAAAQTAVINLENSLSSDNTFGIYAFGLVRAAGTTVTDNNDTGIFANAGGSILTRGNNTVEGNTTDGTFTGPFLAK